MALHTELPIHKVAYDLMAVAIEAARNMPRDVKQLMGGKIRDLCLELLGLIYQANVARDKATAIDALRGRLLLPHRRQIRRRTGRAAIHRLRSMPAEDLWQSTNSYLGLLRQAPASHADRARIANIARKRGLAVDHQLTKAYQ